MAGVAVQFSILLACLCVSRGTVPRPTTQVHARFQPVVPCRLIPFSGWRPSRDAIHVLTTTRLWSFNSSSGVWKDSHLPKSHKLTTSWKVICASYRRVLISNGTHVSAYNRNSSRWVNLNDATNISPSDPVVAWCTENDTHVLWLHSGVHSTIDSSGNISVVNASVFPVATAKKSCVRSWTTRDYVYVLVDKFWNGSRVENATGLWKISIGDTPGDWKLISLWTPEQSGHPVSLTKSYPWADESTLWLWKELPSASQLWSFSVVSQKWTRHRSNHSAALGSPLLAWTHDESPCLLFANSNCSSNYSLSYLHCFVAITKKKKVTDSTTTPVPNSTAFHFSTALPEHLTTVTTGYTVTAQNTTLPQTTTMMAATVTTVRPVTSTQNASNGNSASPPMQSSTFSPKLPTAIGIMEETDDQLEPSALDTSQNRWHQQNSGIFGSIIFFGTSITIFTIVGAVWCIRHCVHFPKDALLLRDPPSVRYTAIPDTIA